MNRVMHIFLLPFVVIFGASGSALISSTAGYFTGTTLGLQRERAHLVEYEDDSPAFLGPFAAYMGLMGGAVGGIVGAAVGWTSKRVAWGAIAGCLPLLIFVFYAGFGQSITEFHIYSGLLIRLAIALSGPPIVGALAGFWARKFIVTKGEQSSMTTEV
jgi:hypothetical protein